jgi:hypothetical protein
MMEQRAQELNNMKERSLNRTDKVNIKFGVDAKAEVKFLQKPQVQTNDYQSLRAS